MIALLGLEPFGMPGGRKRLELVQWGAGLFFCILASGNAVADSPMRGSAALVPESFFQGVNVSRGETWSLVSGRQEFTARLVGRRTRAGLRLSERFHFSDGDPLQLWDLAPVVGGRYLGTVRTEGQDGRMRPPKSVKGTGQAPASYSSMTGMCPAVGTCCCISSIEWKLNRMEQSPTTSGFPVSVSR